MAHFIGYHIDDEYSGDGVPVAAAATYQDAMDQTIRRVLSLGITSGSMAVRERHGLTEDDFAKLGGILDTWFSGKGIQ